MKREGSNPILNSSSPFLIKVVFNLYPTFYTKFF